MDNAESGQQIHFFCHTCEKTFTIAQNQRNEDDEVPCEFCKETFVEELEAGDPRIPQPRQEEQKREEAKQDGGGGAAAGQNQ